VYISITRTNLDEPMFFTRTSSKIPNSSTQIDSIRDVVKQWEKSTQLLGLEGAIGIPRNGSGWPITVEGVEGAVAVLVVIGLEGEERSFVDQIGPGHRSLGTITHSLNHTLIVEALEEFLGEGDQISFCFVLNRDAFR
jgi:hypothetical protein